MVLIANYTRRFPIISHLSLGFCYDYGIVTGSHCPLVKVCDYLLQQRQDLTKRFAELAAKNADAMRRAEAAEEEVPRSDWLTKNARIFANYIPIYG